MVQEINAVAKPALVVNIEAIRCRGSNGNDVSLAKITSQIKFSRIVHGHTFMNTHMISILGASQLKYYLLTVTLIYEFCVL